ncbi:hypothetical protein [Tenacibaculum piscium]|uniref:hypothetical protein n=1 Tax=Tenacibaculum piscium TaxID=1458515 RepID=UPI00135659CC|nr:hypothetical protein [Tenacibaculum piscium]MBE7630136.1 hypothetical protein [Tenacibaculum piscium]MBE7671066.1 hypothetical protein [Tenacibaculum piscium]MBE7685984.1 hypothetical protein [Tenacibaculum piscium]MBE7690891.1 hypothetical protein [Tenacibaculum piscium]MCG8184184.1 hypothetical protein [Tenacibaculum piscium]
MKTAKITILNKLDKKYNPIEIRFKEKPVSKEKINLAWERLKNQVKSAEKTHS